MKRFKVRLALLRLVCLVRGHRRVDIAMYDEQRVTVCDCCRRCGHEWAVRSSKRVGPRPANRFLIEKHRAR